MKNLSILKLKTISFIIVALLLLVITVVSENNGFIHKKESDITSLDYISKQTLSQENTDIVQKSLYSVKEHEGIIAVFKKGEENPIITERIAVSSLPEEDRRLLLNGVQFSTYKDMLAFLENYE